MTDDHSKTGQTKTAGDLHEKFLMLEAEKCYSKIQQIINRIDQIKIGLIVLLASFFAWVFENDVKEGWIWALPLGVIILAGFVICFQIKHLKLVSRYLKGLEDYALKGREKEAPAGWESWYSEERHWPSGSESAFFLFFLFLFSILVLVFFGQLSPTPLDGPRQIIFTGF